MNIQYFFIADRVKSKEICIEYCPTGIVVADYFTKPLQGIIFQQLQDMITVNTNIALPMDTVMSTAVQTNGIPAVSTQQESRSVLESEIVIDKSLQSHTVLPARVLSARVRAEKVGSLTALSACIRTSQANSLHAPQANDYAVGRPSNLVNRHGLSWAQIASWPKRG
jgi:hypothetical protein